MSRGVAMYGAVQKSTRSTEQLVVGNAPLVKRIAYHLMSRLPPSVQVEDLIQAGMIGLLEAAKNYQAGQGASFETFAGIRIRGAMLDEIRRTDWAPRSVHRKARMVADAIHKIENEHGRDARPEEVAEKLNISLQEYHQILQDSSSCQIFSYDELVSDGQISDSAPGQKAHGPLEGLQQEGFKQALAKAIAGLPERERLVVSLYYDEELNLKEIGAVLNVSESRVSQVHSQAMIRLRARMKEWTSK